MKKSVKIIFSALILCTTLILSACVPPPSYLITSSSSDTSWGRINGSPTEEITEGTDITLTAIELSSAEHPFVCWVKDYNKVVSNETILEIKVDQDTAGHYTAVFDEETEKMLFSTLSSISMQSSDSYSNMAFTLNYSSSKSGSNNYTKLLEDNFDPTTQYTTDKSSVFYFGPLGSSAEYKFEMQITLTDVQGNVTNHNLKFSQKVDNTTFVTTSTVENTDISVSLNFEKLSYEMYQNIEEE